MHTQLRNEFTAKRRLASLQECQIDLDKELPLMFQAFRLAFKMYENEIVQTPVGARARAFEASLLNSKMIQSVQQVFPVNWKFGKYRRFILRIHGYTVLFKKLNGKNMPMNISTNYSQAISNQLVMSLFEDSTYSVDPILFFGYKKSRTGDIVDPKLVYIDDNQVKWTITEKDVKQLVVGQKAVEKLSSPALPKLKTAAITKKAANG